MMPQADQWMRDAVGAFLQPDARVLDIGAGLRLDPAKGNVVTDEHGWMRPLLARARYEVMDAVDTYHPDIVGDIMSMPVADQTYEVVFCLSVLEHVQKPWVAFQEMYRVLKPGGALVGYVPFLSPYHAMPGYYGDYYRFTEEAIRFLANEYSRVDVRASRGPVETLFHLLPAPFSAAIRLGRFCDRWRPHSGKQVAGYVFLAVK